MALDRMRKPIAAPTRHAAGESIRLHAERALLFCNFRLEADGSLFRGATLIHLPPRELAALRLLLANAGQIVTHAQLKQALWGDVHVTADSVPRCLSSLRARLEPTDCIQTVYKRGYRLLAELQQYIAPRVEALPRLVILPFTGESGVPEHLGPAIAEETIARLSNTSTLPASIVARDSIFALYLRNLTAQQIGQTLKADLVLTGTLRALTSHFRLRAEMIRVADGIQIWVEDLIVERGRIAGLESDLSSRLGFRLSASPSDSGQGSTQVHMQQVRADDPAPGGAPAESSLARWGTESTSISAAAAPTSEASLNSPHREAFEVFQRGHYEWQTLERHRMQDGMQYLIRAAEMDPSLVAAKVDLVRLCVTQSMYGYMSPTVAANLLYRTAESIPDLPQTAAAILPSLGWVNFHVDRNLPAALWAFSLSAHLPHDTFTPRERSQFGLSRHRFDEVIALLEATLLQDPYAPWLHARLAWTYHLSGRAAESMECLRHGAALFPGHEGLNFYGSMIHAYNGEAAHAVQLAEKVTQLQPHIDLLKAVHAYALACAGRTAEARTILERLNWLSHERFVLKSFTPAVHVALGDLDGALRELRSAESDRCPWFFQMLADPRLKPLQGHPEFDKLKAILTRLETSASAESDPGASAPLELA